MPTSRSEPRARPRPFTFHPPRTSPWLVGLVQRGIHRAMRRELRVTEVSISDEDLATLRQLKGQRCLVTPSHSGGFEPHILMYLSKVLGDMFHYVACIELFERGRLHRWLLPRLGVYSIMRGTVDRPSFTTTRQLLAAGTRWLVIFPEGEAIWQNSTLVPFQQGVFQLAMKAFEDAHEQDADAHLYVVPMAIKYVYLADMHDELDESLARLEERLNVNRIANSDSRYARLRAIAEAVLTAQEKAHRAKPAPGSTMNDRIGHLKELVTAKMERQLGIDPKPGQPPLDRVRTLFNAVDRVVSEEPPASEYERQLAVEQQQLARSLYDDLWRLLQFVAIYDGYVGESITMERFMDVLCLLEMEVFKQRRVWGPRRACVKVAPPIDLRDHYAAYLENKRATVEQLTTQVESTVRGMLDALGEQCSAVRDG